MKSFFLLFLRIMLQNRYVSCSSNQNTLGKVALFKFLLFHFVYLGFFMFSIGLLRVIGLWISILCKHISFPQFGFSGFFSFLSPLWKLAGPLFRSPFSASQENGVKSFCNNVEVYITNKMSFMQFMLHNMKSLSLRHRDLVLFWCG